MLDWVVRLDHGLFFLINNGLGRPELDSFFEEMTALGAWAIGLVALAFLSDCGRKVFWRHVVVLLVAMLVTVSVGRMVKKTVGRSRPVKAFQEQVAAGTAEVRVVTRVPLRHNAFPSGHSALSFFFMTYVGLYRKAARPWVLLLAGLIAFSRVYVGAHFPLDCVAGACLGALGGWLAWQGFLRWSAAVRGEQGASGEAAG